MAERNCSRCGTKHSHPWGKSCTVNVTYKEEIDLDNLLEHEGIHAKGVHLDITSLEKEYDMEAWLNEAVAVSKQASHEMVKQMEDRLQSSMDDKFSRLERLFMGKKPHPYVPTKSESQASTGSHPPAAQTAPEAGQGLKPATGVEPTVASTAVTGQLSDALKQLSLAIDTSTGDKGSGMLLRPEWHAQHKVKDILVKSLDHQKMSLNDLYYGMTCVLEHLLHSGSEHWQSYLQHRKYVSRGSQWQMLM